MKSEVGRKFETSGFRLAQISDKAIFPEVLIEPLYEYQEDLEVARGTVQNAISYLKSEGAFKLISKGHQGSFISEINCRSFGNDWLSFYSG